MLIYSIISFCVWAIALILVFGPIFVVVVRYEAVHRDPATLPYSWDQCFGYFLDTEDKAITLVLEVIGVLFVLSFLWPLTVPVALVIFLAYVASKQAFLIRMTQQFFKIIIYAYNKEKKNKKEN